MRSKPGERETLLPGLLVAVAQGFDEPGYDLADFL